jgi:hypothetical protein
VGPAGQGAWCPLGWGRLGLNRLGLSDDQVQKIRGILDKARSEALASIQEVLTEEQARQFEQMRSGTAQPGRGIGCPALQGGPGEPVGPRFQQGMGQGPQMRHRGRRLSARQENLDVPRIEQMFDRADANQDGALTKDEFRAFREKTGQGQ